MSIMIIDRTAPHIDASWVMTDLNSPIGLWSDEQVA